MCAARKKGTSWIYKGEKFKNIKSLAEVAGVSYASAVHRIKKKIPINNYLVRVIHEPDMQWCWE